jgi:hypothetical protein
LGKGRERKKKRMRLYKKRHVLLQIANFGWDYCGFAVQVKQ